MDSSVIIAIIAEQLGIDEKDINGVVKLSLWPIKMVK